MDFGLCPCGHATKTGFWILDFAEIGVSPNRGTGIGGVSFCPAKLSKRDFGLEIGNSKSTSSTASPHLHPTNASQAKITGLTYLPIPTLR